MPNHIFRFKQFTINQSRSAMKIGTDGILLGSWANPSNAKTILDIGTGTGVLALMLAQKSTATIDAIEVDENSFIEATENINNSKWKERINTYHISLQEYTNSTDKKYDLIICNPPYFINSLKAETKNRTIARHNDTLSNSDLLEGVIKLLSDNGSFYVILPFDNGKVLISEAEKINLLCTKKLFVKPKATIEIKRLLLKFDKISKPIEEETLIIENELRHHYTDEFKELTQEYYLSYKL